MSDLKALLERADRAVADVPLPAGGFEGVERRRDRRRRNQRVTAGVVGMAVFVALVWFVTNGGPIDRTQTPVVPGDSSAVQPSPPVSAVGAVPKTDYLLDLNTGEMTPLPESIVGTEDLSSDYAVSPDGSKLAYAGPGDNGERQVYVANLDGTGVEQVTSEGKASNPAWSPDGSKIAYLGALGDDPDNVFVLDLATGSSTQLTFHTWPKGVANGPSFTPDGSSILYGVYDEDGHGRHARDDARMVPTSGGESVPGGVYGARISPDGSLMSYGCHPIPHTLCLANADGSDARVLIEASDAITAGRWSPDGTRIAVWQWPTFQVYVVDVATGERANVADGDDPVWLDDHTLIVEHTGCLDPHPEGKCAG